MRQFALFLAIIILSSAPCILGTNKIHPIDVNPEASKQAKELLNELWPKLEQEAKENENSEAQYWMRLFALEEAAHRAETTDFTRLAKEIRSLFTGKDPQYDRAKMISLIQAQENDIGMGDVIVTALNVQLRDQDPKVTNEMVRQDAKGFLAKIGLLQIANQVQLFLDQQLDLIALCVMLLITRRSIP